MLFFQPNIPAASKAIQTCGNPDPAGQKSGQVCPPPHDRTAQAKRRAKILGWDVVTCAPGRFAVTREKNDTDRYPSHGTISLDELELFIKSHNFF